MIKKWIGNADEELEDILCVLKKEKQEETTGRSQMNKLKARNE